jgi:hypothetical protein
MDFNNQKVRKEIKKAQTELEQQKEAVIKEVREWVRKWDASQREMVLWILEEEVRKES